QRGTTVEAKLLQIGVALEALCYALWQEDGKPGGNSTPKYPDLLECVTDAARVVHHEIYGPDGAESWRTSFNLAFKGTKHADNPLPDGLDASRFARQGLNLMRAWLGTRLGVPENVLVTGL